GSKALISLDVSKFDTSKVTNMGCMFSGCHGLTNLKISNFNTSKVTDMRYMFMSCYNLTTIYAAAGTDWGSIENITSYNMFHNCDSLKGGNNTVYDESKRDKTYARIDGLDGKPGYFTIKPAATE
ncbi:MAG: BspA family leucine-rich repeat surface protein, partial [Treponema sp.]|nr:BspA family leucine-rich repeat surface protein [Treponema sp.]